MDRYSGLAGTDVLFLRVWLIDIKVKVPPEPSATPDRIYARELGEVTMLAELLDSTTGTLLAQAADRRAVGHTSAGLIRVSPVAGRAEMTEMYQFWAKALRDRLDETRTLAAARPEGSATPVGAQPE